MSTKWAFRPIYKHEEVDSYIYPEKEEKGWCIGWYNDIIEGRCGISTIDEEITYEPWESQWKYSIKVQYVPKHCSILKVLTNQSLVSESFQISSNSTPWNEGIPVYRNPKHTKYVYRSEKGEWKLGSGHQMRSNVGLTITNIQSEATSKYFYFVQTITLLIEEFD